MPNRNHPTASIISMVLAWIKNTVPVTTALFLAEVDFHLIYQDLSMAPSFILRFTCILPRIEPQEPINHG